MDLVVLFQYVPKLALVLLIIIGGLIVVEMVNIIRDKQPKPKETNSKTHPENLQPILFQEQSEMVVVPLSIPQSRKRLLTPIILLSILTIAIIATTVFKRQSKEQPAQPIPEEPQPTEASPSSIIAPPVIKVYQFDKNNAWIELTTDDLAKLKPYDEIFIAIATAKTYTKALFTINGEEMVYVKEGYMRYTIPATETKVAIEVMLLNE